MPINITIAPTINNSTTAIKVENSEVGTVIAGEKVAVAPTSSFNGNEQHGKLNCYVS